MDDLSHPSHSNDIPAPAQVDTGSIGTEQDRPDWLELRAMPLVAAASEAVLRKNNASRDTRMTAQKILAEAKSYGSLNMADNTFVQYLSKIAKQVESPIASTGRGRDGGYYLSDQTDIIAREAVPSSQKQTTTQYRDYWGKEQWLYPALVAWLQSEGYQAMDTSEVRSRDLGKWGNPDVTGLLIHEFIGRHELEIATIEAKLGFDAWEQDFFQAVSQKRFSNRAYFAFALPEDASDKLPADLRYYSERFDVGVLVIDLPNDVYHRLTSGTLTEDDRTLLHDVDATLVREVLSAKFSHVPLGYQQRLCEALDIANIGQLCRWGT